MADKESLRRARVEKHGEEMQQKLEQATVAVCGLGGLGSNIANLLTRAGVGKLILIDFDRVEITNLQRQMYKFSQIGQNKADALKENLLEIDPYAQLETHVAYITADNAKELLQGADVVCEAFDKAENKAMLTEIVLEQLPQAYLVAASGMAGLDSVNAIRTRKIGRRFYLCGDEVSDVGDVTELFSSRVMTCAAHQAHAVLRILGEQYEV